MPCAVCYQQKTVNSDYVIEEATRVVSWETAGSPMVPACDHHALAMAGERFIDYTNITIDHIDSLDW